MTVTTRPQSRTSVTGGAPTVHPRRAPSSLGSREAVAARAALVVLTLYPVAWLVGVGWALWPALLVAVLPVVLTARLPRASVGLVAIALTVALSVPVSVAVGVFSASRLVGLAANLAVWVAVAGLVHLVVKDEEVLVALARRLVWIMGCQGVLTLASAALSPARLPVPLLGGLASRLPEGLSAFMVNELYFPTWFDGPVYRSAGLMGRPTWGGGFAVVAAVAATWLWRRRRLHGASTVVVVVLAAVSVYLSYSRATYLALGLGLLAALVVLAVRRGGALLAAVLPLLAVAVVGLWVGWSSVAQSIVALNEAREDSATTRGDIYLTTWRMVRELPVPLLGYGIKPQEDGLVASVATHSTYLGLLFRGGIIACLLFVAVLAVVAVAARRSSTAVLLVVFVAGWCVLEDFDPGHLVPMALVIAAGAGAAASRPEDLAARAGQS